MTESTWHWSGELLDLEAYLARIGYAGVLAPTAETLRALHRAHVSAVPFENLEIILGRPIPLDLDSLQDKLVRRPRGGYCYEHTSLFAAALERLGFGVTGLASRVTMGSDKLLPETHAILRVETLETPETGRVWIADVGFGSTAGPIELAAGAESSCDGWHYRLVRRTAPWGSELWMLQEHRPDGWLDLHGFTLQPRYPIDYVVGNHYVSSHHRSPFVTRPFAQRLRGDSLHVLDGTTWTLRRADGSLEERSVEPADVPKTLGAEFGIVLDADDAARLVAGLEE